MDKKTIFDIWKQDAIDNGFVCKNCKHYKKSKWVEKYCSKNVAYRFDDHFCSDFEFCKDNKKED